MANELIQCTNLVNVLQDLANEVEKGYKESLVRNDHVASGDLLRSVHAEVEVRGTTYTVWLNLADYWAEIEHGIRPHWPDRDAILRWIFIKPVIPRPDNNGRIPSAQSLAYLISRKIAREGTEGTHDLRDTEDAILPKYEEKIAAALEEDALRIVEELWP